MERLRASARRRMRHVGMVRRARALKGLPGEPVSAVVGTLAALLLGLKRRSLIEVALFATAAAYITSLILPLL